MSGSTTRRHGFTLVEVLFATALTGMLAVMISGAWSGIGRPLVDLIERSRVMNEVRLAAASLAADCGGHLPGTTGSKSAGRFVGWMTVDDSELRLCFDGEVANGIADWAAPDSVIIYQVEDGRLIRTQQLTDSTVTIAHHVDKMQLSQEAGEMEIQLQFTYRNYTCTHTLIARIP